MRGCPTVDEYTELKAQSSTVAVTTWAIHGKLELSKPDTNEADVFISEYFTRPISATQIAT
jgi:hypothetical protein